ncbi:noncanonical pyrimidine nucleotidase, YjjG family [Alginatibacterium sediminis]|uniref:Noncanonical pyrimidine nucleotidase, YjjG family n=1 Tax=Alginatibacterium sediminis TaxID=2164068 RepID=A0A420EI01_9ALTE|nr:YjjG family noncanonical pyrimidine nucleotidase [Alginatibacterium sediminis]RKF20186.1 noncanonical pyrimidine nucleotidase, YjjG family [Alginatibacterium sediminis]
MPYPHIIFDLDHTLWDFEANAEQVLNQLYNEYLKELNIERSDFMNIYRANNHHLWQQYHEHKITKHELKARRFPDTLTQLGLKLADLDFDIHKLEHHFIERSVEMDAVFPHCHRVLDALAKSSRLHIMTNGFVEAQHRKMKSAKIDHYFEHIFISEEIGANKPSSKIFEFALAALDCTANDCLMVGDNLVADVGGAKDIGMDQVWFNPDSLDKPATIQPSFEIKCLSELLDINH